MPTWVPAEVTDAAYQRVREGQARGDISFIRGSRSTMLPASGVSSSTGTISASTTGLMPSPLPSASGMTDCAEACRKAAEACLEMPGTAA